MVVSEVSEVFLEWPFGDNASPESRCVEDVDGELISD